MEKKRSFTLTPILTPFLAAILLILLSVSGKLFSSYNDIEENPNEFLLLISVVQLIVFVFPCIIYYFLKGRKLNTPFLISPIKPGQIVFVISSALLLVSGNLLIKCFYYIGLGSLPSGVDYLISDTGQLSDANMLTVIISIALIPAVCEELFFRGIVLSEYKIYGTFNAVLFSAFSFAMIHFSLPSFPLYFFSGLVLGVTAAVTGSVFASAIIHFISNVLSIYISDSFLRVTIQRSGGFFAAFLSGALFLLFLVLVLSTSEGLMWKKSESGKLTELPPKSLKHISTVFFTPGFFGLVLIFVLITVLK